MELVHAAGLRKQWNKSIVSFNNIKQQLKPNLYIHRKSY